MIRTTCLVAAEQTSEATEAALRSQLAAFTQRAFGAPPQINWIIVPAGSGFTAGKPSTASVVSIRATEPLEQTTREALLRELSNFWMAETQCSHDELVAVISDPATA